MTTAPGSSEADTPADSRDPASPGATRNRAARNEDAAIAVVTMGVLLLPSILVVAAIPWWQSLFGLAVALAITGAILVRRRHGVVALAGLTALAGVHVLLTAPLYPFWFGVLVVLYSVGRFSGWRGRLVGFLLAIIAAVLAEIWAIVVLGFSPTGAATDWLQLAFLWLPPFLLFGMAIVIGWSVRQMVQSVSAGRIAREQHLLAQTAERRADEQVERAALARDMHDVVAHSLAVVIAQAQGARYTPDVESKDAALERIAQTSRQALGDVRLLLAQLRHAQAPEPVASLEEVDALVERMRSAGLDVRMEQVGEPVPLPRTADIAAYRLVQEALTNALRHGDRDAPVHVRLHWGHGVTIDVHNRLLHAPGPAGHGVRGMHERSQLAGGRTWTGIDEGWFRVHATFPALDASRRDPA